MGWLREDVFDDRGQAVRIGRIDSASYANDIELLSAMQRTGELQQYGTLSAKGVTIGALIITVMVVLLAGLGATLIPFHSIWILPVIIAFLIATVAPIGIRNARSRFDKRALATLLFIGRCPCCGYRIREQPVEPDGTIVCPECGSAWKAERVGTARQDQTDIGLRSADKRLGNSFERSFVSSWTRRGSVLDDRERGVPLIDFRLSVTDPSLPEDRVLELRKLLRKETLGERYGCAVLALVFLLPGMISAIIALAQSMSWLTALRSASQVFWLIFVVAIVYRSIRGWTPWVGRTVKRLLVAQRVCPSCTADLQSAPRESDGCVVCAKCGAAWKTPSHGVAASSLSRNTTSV